jgi:hypothetical protein
MVLMGKVWDPGCSYCMLCWGSGNINPAIGWYDWSRITNCSDGWASSSSFRKSSRILFWVVSDSTEKLASSTQGRGEVVSKQFLALKFWILRLRSKHISRDNNHVDLTCTLLYLVPSDSGAQQRLCASSSYQCSLINPTINMDSLGKRFPIHLTFE